MEVVDITDVTRDSKPVEIKLEDVASDTENPSESTLKFLLETQRSPNPTSLQHSQENSGDDGEFQYMCNTTKEEVRIISYRENVGEENNQREVINEVQKTVDSTLIQTVELVKPLRGVAAGSNNEKVHTYKANDGKCVKEGTAEETLNKSQPDGETNQNKYFFDRQVHQDEFLYKTNGYGCAHCLYLSSSWLDTKHHIRFDHRDPSIKKRMKQLKQCPHCPKKATHIAIHIYNCHTESAAIKWLFCGHCDYKTKAKRSLLNHIQRKHIEFNQFKCEECGKGFKIQRQLTDHIKSIHQSGTMVQFTCDSCNYTTRLRSRLNKHMLRHKRREGGKLGFLLMEKNNPREVINEVQKTVDSKLVKPLRELAVRSNNKKVHSDKPNDGKCVRERTAEETINKSQPHGETNQNKYFFDRHSHEQVSKMEVVDITDVTRDSKPVEIKPEDIESDTENPSESIPKFLLETQRSPNPTSVRHSQENSGDDGEFQYMCNATKEEVQIISYRGNVEEENNQREVINEVQKTVDSTLIQTVELVKPLRGLAAGSNNEKVHTYKVNDGKCVKKGTAEETLNKSQPDGETNQNKYFFDRQVHQDEFLYKTNGYGCAHCLYLSSSWLDTKHHIRFDHRDPSTKKRMRQLKQCPHCPKKATHLANHIYHCHTEFAAIKWLFCGHCDYKTKAKHSLLNHIQSRHIEFSELKCEECGKGFKIQRELTDHIKNIHQSGTMVRFTCDSCNYTTRLRSHLNRHMLRHKRREGGKLRFLPMKKKNPRKVIKVVQKTVDSTFIQTVELVKPLRELAVGSNNKKVHNDKPNDGKCVREGTAEETLNKSQPDGETNQNKYFFDRQVHLDEFIYKTNGYGCAHCLYLSSGWQNMMHHIRFDHRDPSIKKRTRKLKQCPHCPKKATHLAKHIYHCHTESAAIKWLFCGHCDYKTKAKHSLLNHIQRKHIEFRELLKCEECGKGFKIQRQLAVHIKRIHKPETMVLFTCDNCNYTTRLRNRLNEHMLVHKQPEEGFVCKKCEFHTQSRGRLIVHNKKEHLDWAQCHLCSYRSISKHALNLHLIHHQDKKKEEDLIYRCNKCHYKTYRVYNLQMHELSHKKPEEIDMFRCYHCDFKAKRKDNLKTHIFKHDLYKNILSCYICTYKTRSNYELKKHIDVHSENQRREKVESTKLANGKTQVDGSEDKNEENVAEQRKKVKNTKASIDVKEKSRKKLKRSCKKLNT